MSHPRFTVRQAVAFGWDNYWRHAGLLFGVALFVLAVQLVPSVVVQSLQHNGQKLFASGVDLLATILSILVTIGVTHLLLRLYDKHEVTFNDIFYAGHFLNYLIVSVVTAMTVILGTILFIVPGIIAAVRLQFSTFLVIDKGMLPYEAIRTSWRMTQGSFWYLVGFNIVAGLIMLLGVLVFGIGVFVAWPVVMLANIYVYRHLLA